MCSRLPHFDKDLVLDHCLARGGLSEVWLARHEGRPVAVKAFRIDADWNESERLDCQRYFHNEAHWLARLHHPNLVRLLGTFDFQNEQALVLEFVAGVDLRRWFDAHSPPRSLSTFYQLARGVAEAVRYLHDSGLMHRDIAPRNIMVTPELETRLLDLQFVREVAVPSASHARPMTGEIGDWAFAAPELMDGFDRCYDERVDIYSLGALLIELLVGRPPRRRSPAQCREDLPEGLSSLLWAMVDESPPNRPSWVEITRTLNLSQQR